jgi:four helix bundle protein
MFRPGFDEIVEKVGGEFKVSKDSILISQRGRDFGFKDQITRSGLSIPSNIAEGFGRTSDKDKLNFLNYAEGSCAELRTQVYIGSEIGNIEKNLGESWIVESEEISLMFTGLMR